MKKIWSQKEIKILKRLKNKGTKHDEIARKIGNVSTNAVSMKVKKLAKRGEIKIKSPIYDDDYTFDNLRKEELLNGLIMWWCEGTKPSKFNVSVEFANSDPILTWHFLKFLRKLNINENKIRLKLKISPKDEIKAKKFWSKLTKLPLSSFNKSSPLSGKGKRKNKLKYGTLSVRYSSKKLLTELTLRWKDVMERDLPKFLERDKYKIRFE